MKKRLIATAIILSILTLLCVSLSAESGFVDSMDFQGTGIELTLDSALSTMLEKNTTVKLGILDLEQANLDYEKNMKTIRRTKGLLERNSTDYLRIVLQELSIKFARENAERSYQATIEGLKADIEKSYYELLQAQELERINKDNLD